MLISCITAVSNKAALLRGIVPIRVVQIKAYVVDTEKHRIYNFQAQIINNWCMTIRLYKETVISIQKS